MLYFYNTKSKIFYSVSEFYIIVPIVCFVQFFLFRKVNQFAKRDLQRMLTETQMRTLNYYISQLKTLKIYYIATDDIIKVILISQILEIIILEDVKKIINLESREIKITNLNYYSKKLKQSCLKLSNSAKYNFVNLIQFRGGESQELVQDKDLQYCKIEKGIRYVNHSGLLELVRSRFRYKAKKGIIFITRHALCQLIKTNYAQLVIPNLFYKFLMVFNIQLYLTGMGTFRIYSLILSAILFLGSMTSAYRAIRIFLNILIVNSMVTGEAASIYSYIHAIKWIIIAVGAGSAAYVTYNHPIILQLWSTTPIFLPLSKIQPRDNVVLPDVVVVDLTESPKVSIVTEEVIPGNVYFCHQNSRIWWDPNCQDFSSLFTKSSIEVNPGDKGYDSFATMEDVQSTRGIRYSDRNIIKLPVKIDAEIEASLSLPAPKEVAIPASKEVEIWSETNDPSLIHQTFKSKNARKIGKTVSLSDLPQTEENFDFDSQESFNEPLKLQNQPIKIDD